ncbi:SHOCT domain-containing protein [Nostocoides sp. F2B08]|uniref:SHOCT domain-containing protein n=1 Tax=Nostocoides sp. F2B08 TaxID=2653936 RepID=UPI001263BDDF|nr:SHOCT domain-containing protein [Tetrasphaera sp. F2B08]KAB7740632.1 SHOCT domain-containing protein [Tetrasphaera sp. F2B08]
MMWGEGYWSGWMWLVMGAGTLTFWVVVILVVRALLPTRGPQSGEPPRPDALTLLKERLARGEVTPEEYEQRRRLLVDGH